jgi:transposase-like protein
LSNLVEKTNRAGTVYFEDVNGVIVSKVCPKCGANKDIADYVKHKGKFAGRRSDCKACNKQYAVENIKSITQYKRKYYEENKEREDLRVQKWIKENKESHSERQRDYRRAWRRDNPDKSLSEKQRRRAVEHSLPNHITSGEVRKITRNIGKGYHLDHFIPLAIYHGGSYLENLIAIPSEWNASKGAKHPFEWADLFFVDDENGKLVFYEKASELATLNGLTFDEYRAFVDWCFANPRIIDEVRNDDRYSIEIWRSVTNCSMPLPAYVYK